MLRGPIATSPACDWYNTSQRCIVATYAMARTECLRSRSPTSCLGSESTTAPPSGRCSKVCVLACANRILNGSSLSGLQRVATLFCFMAVNCVPMMSATVLRCGATATAAGRAGSDRLLRAYLCVGVSHSRCFRLRCHKVWLCAAVFTMPCLQQCAHFSRWLSVLNHT